MVVFTVKDIIDLSLLGAAILMIAGVFLWAGVITLKDKVKNKFKKQ